MKIEEVFEDILARRKTAKGSGYRLRKYEEYILNQEDKDLNAVDRVFLARYKNRPKGLDFVENIIDDPIFLHGDRCFGEDKAIICGLGKIEETVVTFIAINKGRNTEESIKNNFGMVNPEGYRKAIRLMKQAEKFGRPVITIIDTPGAYPGVGAEERGQAEAIAKCMYTLTKLNTNIITIITGEAASGGAIALGICDYMIMMENAIYSILSPEGFASILWKDSSRAKEAMEVMKLTSYDLLKFGFVDEVVKEKLVINKVDFIENFNRVKSSIIKALRQIEKIDRSYLLERRRNKYGEFLWD